jgi:hypothetical protein
LLIPYSIIFPWGLTCISSSRCSSWYMVARDFCRHFAQQISWIGGSAGALCHCPVWLIQWCSSLSNGWCFEDYLDLSTVLTSSLVCVYPAIVAKAQYFVWTVR